MYLLKVLYNLLKEKYPASKISLTKFFELCPKWCISSGCSGTQNVCICSIHQNAVVVATACRLNYKDMMAAFVFSLDHEMCMVHKCYECPGKAKLVEFLQCHFQTEDLDSIEELN